MSDDFLTNLRATLRRIIYRTYRPYRQSRFDTSDVVQESMIQIFQELNRSGQKRHEAEASESVSKLNLQESESIEDAESRLSTGWLTAIIKGTIGNQLRFHKAQKRNHQLDVRFEDAQSDSLWDDQMSPEETSMMREAKARLLEELQLLPEQSRTIICLRFYESKTLDEIANELNITVYAVRSTLEHSFRTLIQKCADNHDSFE